MQIKKSDKGGQLGRARKRFCPCCGRSMSGRVARELAYREGIERLAEVLPIGATAPAEACIGALAMTSDNFSERTPRTPRALHVEFFPCPCAFICRVPSSASSSVPGGQICERVSTAARSA